MPYAHITGWGKSVPEKVLTNDDLSKTIDTNDAWIRDRTGIRERHIASETQTTASLGAAAAIEALKVANVLPADVDLIICSTSTPEYLFPATACLIQDAIGADNAGAFDLLAACSGFIFALNLGAQAIKGGTAKTVVIIGSETLSRVVNWKDRNTCILFGDGAGAFVLQASEKPGGILNGIIRSDGSGGDLLSIPAGGSRHPLSEVALRAGLQYVQMDGKEVYRFATRVMASATESAITASGLKKEDIDLIIPHQANSRIIEAAAKGLKLPMDKFMVNVDKYGNTSTASIPLATVEAYEKGRLKSGDKIVFVGFGAGLTWGSLAAEWSGPINPDTKVNLNRYKMRAQVRSFMKRMWRRVEGVIWGRDE
jgi:3-oxoacyl-[acyl-carrier-protein] synthase-3